MIPCAIGHVQAQLIHHEDGRWFADFRGVPEGKHTLHVLAEDGTTDSLEMEIVQDARAHELAHAGELSSAP